jgi:hypothetical protein
MHLKNSLHRCNEKKCKNACNNDCKYHNAKVHCKNALKNDAEMHCATALQKYYVKCTTIDDAKVHCNSVA